MVQATVALRVDVDTRRGVDTGVPVLLDLFRALDVRASFFVTMGPDHSGRAIRRALRPSFVVKMVRTNAFRLYGLRTLLSGTLVPARLVGAEAPAVLGRIAHDGHELGIHGWDHVRWQDRIGRLGADRIGDQLDRAAQAFQDIVGRAPSATAAPGWRTSAEALAVQERYRLDYASDTRGTEPFLPDVEGARLATLQVPTTMPTVDEMLGRVRDVPGTLLDSVRPGTNVFTLHAEVEGGPLRDAFSTFLERARQTGVRFARLCDVVARVREDERPVPVAPVVRTRVVGRSGWVSAQGPARRTHRLGPPVRQTAATSEGWT